MRGTKYLFFLGLALLSNHSDARDLYNSEVRQTSVKLASSLKGTTGLFAYPEDPLLFPDSPAGASLWRLRLEPSAQLGPSWNLDLAYEQRAINPNSSVGTGIAFFPPETPAPFRIRQVRSTLGSSSSLFWAQELDRAFASFRFSAGTLIVGRQAMGWGRGTVFTAIDIFAPFSPLEIDREWKRGVDAVRAVLRTGEKSSLELVSAWGEDIPNSAFGIKYAADIEKADFEIGAGKRATDTFLALSGSAPVLQAEIHGELGLFWLESPWIEGGSFGNDRLVSKAVLGGSYVFNLGNGLTTRADYHFSGFGVKNPSDYTTRLSFPDFQKRLERGDTQILGRHAVALGLSYPLSLELTGSFEWLSDPSDGSGLLAPLLDWQLSEQASLSATFYQAYGCRSQGVAFCSQFGGTPLTGLLQLRIYD